MNILHSLLFHPHSVYKNKYDSYFLNKESKPQSHWVTYSKISNKGVGEVASWVTCLLCKHEDNV